MACIAPSLWKNQGAYRNEGWSGQFKPYLPFDRKTPTPLTLEKNTNMSVELMDCQQCNYNLSFSRKHQTLRLYSCKRWKSKRERRLTSHSTQLKSQLHHAESQVLELGTDTAIASRDVRLLRNDISSDLSLDHHPVATTVFVNSDVSSGRWTPTRWLYSSTPLWIHGLITATLFLPVHQDQ